MSAESTLNTALLAHAPLTAIVGTRIFDTRYPVGTAYPLCVYQRVATVKIQPVTGTVIARSVRLQVTCTVESVDGSRGCTALAEVVEDALVSAIGAFKDVTLGDELAGFDTDAELYSKIVEADCLEAA